METLNNATLNNQNPNATKPATLNNIPKPKSVVDWVISYAAYPIAILVAILLANTGLSIWLSTFISIFATLMVGSFIVLFITIGRNKKNGGPHKLNPRKFAKTLIRSIVLYAIIAAVIALIVSGVAFIFA